MANFIHMISVIDTHAAGEPTRIVLSGLPSIVGATMAAKKQFMRDHLDHFRTLLMHEPRGHRDMFGAVLTPPTTPRGQYGLLFMDNAGYLDMVWAWHDECDDGAYRNGHDPTDRTRNRGGL